MPGGIWGSCADAAVSWIARIRIFPLLCTPNLRWRCRGSRDLSSPCRERGVPSHPEPSLPGTAGRPATISRLLIPRDKSRSLMPPEEEKSRALGREQQTRRWIRCSLPGRVSLGFPCVTRGGTEPGGAEGSRVGMVGSWWSRGWAHPGVLICFTQLVLPQLPSHTWPGCRKGTVAPQSQTLSPPATTGVKRPLRGAR